MCREIGGHDPNPQNVIRNLKGVRLLQQVCCRRTTSRAGISLQSIFARARKSSRLRWYPALPRWLPEEQYVSVVSGVIGSLVWGTYCFHHSVRLQAHRVRFWRLNNSLKACLV
jgi:hypothetical protein